MANNNSNNDSNRQKSCEFNEHINLILLTMFIIVVATILCVKCCSSSNHVQKTDSDTLQQRVDTAHTCTLIQQ